jgi:hypothetical protein
MGNYKLLKFQPLFSCTCVVKKHAAEIICHIQTVFNKKYQSIYNSYKTGKQLLTTFAVFNKDHNGRDI